MINITSVSALIPIIVAITATFSRATTIYSTSIKAINFKSLSIFSVVWAINPDSSA